MNCNQLLEKLLAKENLAAEQMTDVVEAIISGTMDDIEIAATLVAFRAKGVTAEEMAAASRVLRSRAAVVPNEIPNLVDTCGTGGDGLKTFNISTVAGFVAAAAGAKVAKHGNRSVSSSSGSADFLEAAGACVDLDANQVLECIRQTGIGFLFAPKFHPAMKHVAAARKKLGIHTLFNLLGPLSNPANAKIQLMGVFDDRLLEPMAEAAQQLGIERAMLVHGVDGLDEISIQAPTHIVELKDGALQFYTIAPADFGIKIGDLSEICVSDSSQSFAMAQQVFAGESGTAHDIIALNAGAVIYLSGLASDLAAGIDQAREVLLSGSAATVFEQFITTTRQWKTHG